MEYIATKCAFPSEIIDFLDNVFEIREIRKSVGRENGVVFEIRTNEQNHSIPHVHASYGEYNISIGIESGTVLAGNLPKKNQKMAISWVISHKEKLLNNWKNIAISAISNITTTALNSNNEGKNLYE